MGRKFHVFTIEIKGGVVSRFWSERAGTSEFRGDVSLRRGGVKKVFFQSAASSVSKGVL